MPQAFESQKDNVDGKYAIVVSRYHKNITGKLQEGALQTLLGAGISEDKIQVAWVPGAWELPIVAKQFAESGKFTAVICLGAVIKGETTHDLYINTQVSNSLGSLSLEYNLPIGFGLLTCQSMEQAINRAGGTVGNKGEETATAVLETLSVMRQISQANNG
ncbi:MAG: 6,7-dimethyl-8-ribityllumazine synthase [Planctomycetaceae bacterium]|nr:6,7-dimethyl-8-ribityllumazine synthase [Planctomycetaceae bacterium]|tara:strand:- start:2410 stop:2892 length:483 start_codon:yes stop_codon:yes gene_type:complete